MIASIKKRGSNWKEGMKVKFNSLTIVLTAKVTLLKNAKISHVS